VQQVNLIAYQPQQERAYRRLVPRAVRSIEHPNNANLKVKALGVGERERTSHDIHVGAGGAARLPVGARSDRRLGLGSRVTATNGVNSGPILLRCANVLLRRGAL
jgi:hypothetical protein